MAQNGYLDDIRYSGNTLESANGSAALEFAREILLLLKAKPENAISDWYQLNRSGFYPR